MFFREIVGQEQVKLQLIQTVKEGRIPHDDPILGIRTFYESQFLSKGLNITYLQFKIDGEKPIEEPQRFEEQFF